MINAVLYARYSTAMQSHASVEDQFRLLRQRAAREGWTIVDECADRAISGTVRDRPGLMDALAVIQAGRASVLLAESLDRISRDQEDIAGIFKRVRYLGARIVTLSEGEVGAIHIGMGGTLSAIFLEQLADKTRRGQIGRVEAGRIPGGISYGYRAVRRFAADGSYERGLREIDPGEAAIVQRIFEAYAEGTSMLTLAAKLNAEGVPSPRGGYWRANTITGHRKRRNGILHNELYRGRILYNRQSFRKDPDTRKRLSRANDEDMLISAEVPELRIINEELWQRVQDRFSQFSDRPLTQTRRPKRLLSGLMRCGVCGANYIVLSADRWGCSNHRQTGTCSNGVTIFNTQAEKRVWAAIESQLLHPDVIAAYFDELRLALAEERRRRIAARALLERRLAELDKENERIVDAIVKGVPADSFVARMQDIAAERERASAELDTLPDPAASMPLHPGTIEAYRRRVASLHALAEADDDVRAKGRGLLEELIEKIEVSPRDDGRRGADMVVHGQLANFLQLGAADPVSGEAASGGERTLSMVAGVGFEPTTFRL